MSQDIGPRIGLDGEKEFRSQLANVNQSLKTLGAEMKAVTSSFTEGDTSERALAAQSEVLNKQLDAQKQKMEMLSKAIVEETEKGNGNSTATLKMKQQYNEAQAAANNLQKDIDNLGKEVDDASQSIENGSKNATTFGAVLKGTIAGQAIISGVKALGGAVASLGKALVNTFMDSVSGADEILTLSTNTGLATDTIQEFQYMAELTDTSLETITGSMAKLIRNMDIARGGTGAAADAFSSLGVSITNTDGTLRSNQEVFGEVIDKLGQMGNETERDALSMAIFGKSAQDLNSLIATGSEGIAAYAQEAHEMGYVLDNETLGSLGAVDDQMQKAKNQLKAVGIQIASELAPVVLDIAQKFLDWMKTVDWEKVRQVISVALDAVIAVIKWLIQAVKDTIEVFKDIYKWFTVTLPKAVNSFVNEIKEIPQKALQWGRDLIDNFVNGIKEKIQAVKDAVSSVANTVKDFLGFSEPDDGPLSDFHTYAPDMMNLFAQGIRENAGQIKRAFYDSLSGLDTPMPTYETAAAGAVNGMTTALSSNGPITINLVTADGMNLAKWILPSLRFVEKANPALG